MASQRDVKNKIASVKNIQKITRAMEMVAAARLRRAEQRIAALRPYADAIGRMTRQAAQAAGSEAANVPLLREHDSETNVGLLLVTGDRGLAGGFNSQIIRAGTRLSAEISEQGLRSRWYATGRRGVSSLSFRGHELSGSYTGFADRPAYADARTIADDVIQAYVNGEVDRVEMIYNSYVSPLTQHVTRQTLLPLTHEAITAAGEEEDEANATGFGSVSGSASGPRTASVSGSASGPRDASVSRSQSSSALAPVDYEPDPEKILRRLVPDYIEISIYRALVESAAGFFGAQMTAMRSASENAGEIITDYTLQMNRARQAEITQEIMEVVAGAEGLA
jgi:F-type H+-transporting ATPase subunit gamma